ncbi:Protein-lysine N-methyltransferase M142.8 [Halotydeus destructor]|nr:Protein-lysine N-methyltransferase M142.8 [Halotydeus destructor]
MNENEVDDDPAVLSPEALKALLEFYSEQEAVTETLDENTNSEIKEDWQLSQFWYDDETSTKLAQMVSKVLSGSGTVGCISCPTLYIKLRSLRETDERFKNLKIFLFEFDKRFSKYGEDFVFYDYNEPFSVVDRFRENSFDLIVADPPFLSEECFEKTTDTVKHLTSDKIVFCSGSTMADFLRSSLQLHEHPSFIPRHAKNLGNEFRCFLNFDD